MQRRSFLKAAGAMAAAAVLPTVKSRAAQNQPNILWLSTEDISPHLNCYGYPEAHTPTLDQLAADGIRFTHAYTTAGVCAPTRAGIITGMYQNSLGFHHMRAGGEGVDVSNEPTFPRKVRCFSELVREAGYYCTNNYKEDYNFEPPESTWDESSREAHWQNRPDSSTPFFAVFNYVYTHEGSIRFPAERHAEVTSRLTPEQRQGDGFHISKFPAYYAGTVLARRQWAKYYELITGLDYWVKNRLQELEDAGLAEDTIVFFWSDHGVGLPRAKRWLYESGTHIPLIVRIPQKFRQNETPGSVDDRLVSSVDFGPTVLNLIGESIPDYMQGQPFLGDELPLEREYIFGARDRMDERYDLIRMVRDKRYRYIRNYMPYKPFHQFMRSCEMGPVMTELRKLQGLNELEPAAAQFFAKQKPLEELYDVINDPDEIHNLADDPAYAGIKQRLWRAHLDWMRQIKDLGFIPEPELVKIDQKYGSRYAFFRGAADVDYLDRLINVAAIAGRPDKNDRLFLLQALADEDASIRWWAAIGLGNLTQTIATNFSALNDRLSDEAAIVRVAAARGVFYQGEPETALPVLIRELQSEQEWVRLAAAHVLDEMGEAARPAIPQLEKALEDRENKYVVRVANHTLNMLKSTDHQVR